MVFCKWFREAGRLIMGLIIRLPSDDQHDQMTSMVEDDAERGSCRTAKPKGFQVGHRLERLGERFDRLAELRDTGGAELAELALVAEQQIAQEIRIELH